MKPDTQIALKNEIVSLIPLLPSDVEEVYAVASDPKVWEQHPNPNRYQREVFEVYFRGAIESNGAYKIIEVATGKVAGCTRVCNYDEVANCVEVGYTFVGRHYWGSGINHAGKRLLLDHLFEFVDSVIFNIGAQNLRSQISIVRLGAIKVGEADVAYYGEPIRHNFIYRIDKEDWMSNNK
jgi:N-acetyltransferase